MWYSTSADPDAVVPVGWLDQDEGQRLESRGTRLFP